MAEFKVLGGFLHGATASTPVFQVIEIHPLHPKKILQIPD
jgi:hypothetical protein